MKGSDSTLNPMEIRRQHLKGLGIFILTCAILYGPVVFGSKTLQPSLYQPHGLVDGYTYGYEGRTPADTYNVDLGTPVYYEWPLNKLIGNIYRSGELPLWNPYQAGGTPLLADYSSKALFPYQILENISPTSTWDIFLLGRLVIAALFTYLFLNSIGLTFQGAVLGGILYAFSGTFTWFINLEQFANPAMVLPILIYTFEKAVRSRSGEINMRGVGIAGLTFGMLILAGQPEVALYAIFLATLYYILRSVTLRGDGLHIRRGVNLLIILALGVMVAAPLILPFLDYAASSHHLHVPGGDMGVSYIDHFRQALLTLTPATTYLPASESVHEVLAKYTDEGGEETLFRILATNGLWDSLGGYSGVSAIFLTIVGLIIAYVERPRFAPLITFFALFGLSVILKNFGVEPFLSLGRLPLFDQVWSPRWAGPTWVFAFGVSGAIGFDLIKGKAGSTGLYGGIAFTVLLLPLAFIAIPDGIYLTGNASEIFSPAAVPFVGPSILGGQLLPLLILTSFTIIVTKFKDKGYLGLLVMSTVVLELWWDLPRGYGADFILYKWAVVPLGLIVLLAVSLEKRGVTIGALLLFLISTLLLDENSPKGMPERHNPFTEPPYIAFLKDKNIDYSRVIGIKGVLFPNYASAVALHDLHYINALVGANFKRFRFTNLQVSNQGLEDSTSAMWFTGRPERTLNISKTKKKVYKVITPPVEKDIALRLPGYSLLGVRYIITPKSVELNKEAGLEGGTFPLIYSEEVNIYENPEAFDRLFVMRPAPQGPKPEGGGDKNSTTNHGGTGSYIISKDEEEKVRFVEYGFNKVIIDADLKEKGTVVLSDTYGGGWRASVEREGEGSKEVMIKKVSGIVRGVAVDGGRSTITLTYSPWGFTLGTWLALIALLYIVFLVFFRRGGTVKEGEQEAKIQ